MMNRCAFCKYHVCMKEGGLACACQVKKELVEHWFAACRTRYSDRREGRKHWIGSERRRSSEDMRALISA